MGRAKLTMELIKKEKSRNLAFQKKKIALKKKVNELSTLCDVKAMMIIYGPKQTPVQDNQPDIWPENRVEVLELINKYKSQPTEKRKKKTSLLSNFFEDRNKKAQNDLTKLRESNLQAKYPSWNEKFDNFSEKELNEIASTLETKLGSAKKFKIMKENSSNYYAHHLQQQQQKILTKKRSMEFEESDQPNKFRSTSNLRQPIYNSYNSQFPTALLQMQVPMPMPLQQSRTTLDQCTFQRTDNFNNPCVGDSSNGIYAAPFPNVEQNMAYNDPMAGMSQNMNFLNNLMTAPCMPYFGDSFQSMAQSYTDESIQPMPQNCVEYPVRSMEFEESDQPNKFRSTSNLRQPIYNSYNSQFPTALLQMQVPMPMPLQQSRTTLDQCTFQRTDNFNNPCVGDSSNGIYAAPFPNVEQNMAYNDPMAGMSQNMNFLNNLMTAPCMPYFGDSFQSMAQSYTDESIQPMPQNCVEYPVRSMEFEESDQPNKFRSTSNLRQPIYNSYNSQFPTALLQMQVPMPMPLQQSRTTLDQCTFQRTDNFNDPCVGDSSNGIYAAPFPNVEQNMAYNDPMAGMSQNMNFLNNLMTAPCMPYFGDSFQSMAQSYTDESIQPVPQNYVEYPVRSTAEPSQMLAFSPCQQDDHRGNF